MNPAWEKEYRALLSKGIALGRVDILPNGAEKREHPRYKMANTLVWGRVDHSYPVIDKSLTGLAFYSSEPFPVGKAVRISLRRFFVVEAMVVGCEMVETEPLLLGCQYKVRCRFQNLDPALVQVMVALDMEREARPAAVNC